MNKKLQYQIALTQLDGVGHILSKVLLSHFQTPENIFSATRKDFLEIENIGAVITDKILDSRIAALDRAEEELKFLAKHSEIQTHFFTDSSYPNRLKYCDDAPLLLYSSGQMKLNAQRIISMVGTRKMTNYGRKLIKDFLFEIKDSDILVVSGLAYGVDTHVHQTCVDFGIATVGVMAHGLDNVYPAANKTLVSKMKQNGGITTEYITNTRPNRENFPSRNRIVAGLADATIIVESDIKGGSLITADIAASYHRDVFAFPGKVGEQYSSGCNGLIKRQKALLIERAEDLFKQLGWTNEPKKKSRQRQLFVELNESEQKLANIVQKESCTAEELSVKSLLPLSVVRTLLLNLELKGVVRVAPGNKFVIN